MSEARKQARDVDGNDLAALRSSFANPPASARPTPLFWWSGSDLDRDRLAWQLDQLAAKGVGGTIVGYSHLPDGELDHGDPVPFSEEWWELYAWFVGASAESGLTTGIQDYGVLNPLLVSLGDRLGDRNAGSLEQVTATVAGGEPWSLALDGTTVVSVAAWPAGATPLEESPENRPVATTTAVEWTPPAGEWTVSVVTRRDGRIGPWDSRFDPMHPDAGSAVIEAFYEPFADHLGEHLGTAFTTFFQDELEFGLLMPMWNDDVAAACEAAGFSPEHWVHGLWLELDDGEFRAFYRDTVVGLLVRHYFEPIFQWHESHGTLLVMDQLSRGDLRTGRRHYGDYLETMKWYQGPGNDDPDLGRPRHTSEFRASASIAHLHDRPLVVNEAFHSSGWGITPADIVRGANIGFVSGANHLILHAVYYSTEGGWWEWAAPDFHFRQPWWRHSAPLWDGLTRTSALLRSGHNVADVALIDPTQDLELTGSAVRSPELALALLSGLGALGVNSDLVPMSSIARSSIRGEYLEVESARYRVVVVPAVRALRRDCLDALNRFASHGGHVIALAALPAATEFGPIPGDELAGWTLCDDDAPSVARAVAAVIDPDIVINSDIEVDVPGVAVAHRRLDDADCYFVVNVGDAPVSASCSVRGYGTVERWDPWAGTTTRLDTGQNIDGRSRFNVELSPGDGEIFVVVQNGDEASQVTEGQRAEARDIPITGRWEVTPISTLDNRHGDFEFGSRQLGIETWHVEAAPSPAGPWRREAVRDGVRFFVLGPVAAGSADELASRFSAVSRLDTEAPVRAGDALLHWRPYRFSTKTGITDDPLQRDRMTGPHGLKSVSDEFLDPTVVDPDARPGDFYLYWSTVTSEVPTQGVTISGRTELSVWVDGDCLARRTEVPARFFAPWGLRDSRPKTSVEQAAFADAESGVVVAMTVSGAQPSRAAVVVGGRPPATRPKSRLVWWHGEAPALEYRPNEVAPGPASTWIRAMIPPGAISVEVESHEPVISASAGGQALPVTLGTDGANTVSTVTVAGAAGPLLVQLGDPDGRGNGSPVLCEPLRWQTGSTSIDLADWRDLGLSDFSGAMSYVTQIDLPEVSSNRVSLELTSLELTGLVGTAEVRINGLLAGTLMIGSSLPLTAALRAGANRIEIEVANTLANFVSRLPSPFSGTQAPSGGFTAATLHVSTTATDSLVD